MLLLATLSLSLTLVAETPLTPLTFTNLTPLTLLTPLTPLTFTLVAETPLTPLTFRCRGSLVQALLQRFAGLWFAALLFAPYSRALGHRYVAVAVGVRAFENPTCALFTNGVIVDDPTVCGRCRRLHGVRGQSWGHDARTADALEEADVRKSDWRVG